MFLSRAARYDQEPIMRCRQSRLNSASAGAPDRDHDDPANARLTGVFGCAFREKILA